MNNKAMEKLSYGIFVVTAEENGKDNGCIINTGIQVTTDPQRFCFAVNKSNYTHNMILQTKKCTLSILSESVDFELIKRFGFQSGRDVNKFEGFKGYKRGANGLPYITEGANAYIAGWVEQAIDLGTHTLFIAMVTDMQVLNDEPSATYAYYHANIKPKPQAAKTEEEGKSVWVCKVCGYKYEGEELPEDYICPLCKHPASDFEKIS